MLDFEQTQNKGQMHLCQTTCLITRFGTLSKSYCNRKQSSSKNRKREEEKSELIAPYTLPKIVSDTLKNWLSASEQFSTEEFSENKA